MKTFGPFEYLMLAIGTFGLFWKSYDTFKAFNSYRKSGEVVEKTWKKATKYILTIIGTFLGGIFCTVALIYIIFQS